MANINDKDNTPVTLPSSVIRQTMEQENREFARNHAKHECGLERLDKSQTVTLGGRRGK